MLTETQQIIMETLELDLIVELISALSLVVVSLPRYLGYTLLVRTMKFHKNWVAEIMITQQQLLV